VTHPHFSPDVSDFLGLLSRHGVRYLIVGGEAVIHYGHARLTGDIDVFYDRTTDNARALYDALREFWRGAVPGMDDPQEFLDSGAIFQFGVPPNRIDLLNTIDGVSFEECWVHRVETVVVPDIPVIYIGLAELIRNKAACGREKDLDDLRYLRRIGA
jgi:predicted nucleotidyltransferase